jgi:hypothetical protein
VVLAGLLLPAYPQKQKPHFKVQVNLVSLDVEVLDRRGKPIDSLKQSDFVVKEDGSIVEISNFARLSDLPISLVVVLGTGFMPQANLSLAKDAIFQLIYLLKPEDEICLYSFDQRNAYLEQDFTRDRPELVKALENIGVPSRSKRPGRLTRGFATPPQTGLGIDLGLAAAKRGTHSRKGLLLIRDRVEGLGTGSLEHVRDSRCTLIALGFSEEARNRLTLVSDPSGYGQLITERGEAVASGRDGSVAELCRTVAHLLSSRYSITYHTPLPDTRGARHIEVLLPAHDYTVLARRSYASSR